MNVDLSFRAVIESEPESVGADLLNGDHAGDRHELMFKLAAHRLQCDFDRRKVSLHDFPDARHADP